MNEGKLYLKTPSAQEANRDIVFMVFPLLVMACYLYGARPAALCAAAALTAICCDYLVAWLRGTQKDRTENSSVPAALLMTMLMPATVDYYIIVVATVIIVLVGKAAFGGWGVYPFNPAALGYCAAAVSWPDRVFRYPAPYTAIGLWDTSSATMMDGAAHSLRAGGMPNIRMLNLILGNYAGAMGATSAIVLVAIAMYLWMRRDINVAIPAGFLLTCAFIAVCFPRIGEVSFSMPMAEQLYLRYQSLKYELLTGGVLFAAVFLVNEPCTRPKNSRAHLAYGVLMGVMTMMFRYFGSYDVGVCFAVLSVNAISGYLDRAFAPRAHKVNINRKEA